MHSPATAHAATIVSAYSAISISMMADGLRRWIANYREAVADDPESLSFLDDVEAATYEQEALRITQQPETCAAAVEPLRLVHDSIAS